MKCILSTALGLALASAHPAFAATAAPTLAIAAVTPAHVQAVQGLLASMQVEKALWGVAARSRYQSEAQRQAVNAKIGKTPPTEVYRRLAPALAPVVSMDTATEMTRFYSTAYGKQVIHNKYNSGTQLLVPGMRTPVPPQEQRERKRAAYVAASKALADAEPAFEREEFKLIQAINKEQH